MCETRVGIGNLWLSFMWSLENILFVMLNLLRKSAVKAGNVTKFLSEKSEYISSMNELVLVIVITETILFP